VAPGSSPRPRVHGDWRPWHRPRQHRTRALLATNLPGAVRPCEREAVAAPDREGDTLEERIARELLPEVGCDEDGNRRKRRGAARRDQRTVGYPLRVTSRGGVQTMSGLAYSCATAHGSHADHTGPFVCSADEPPVAHARRQRVRGQSDQVARAPGKDRHVRRLLRPRNGGPSAGSRRGRLSARRAPYILEPSRSPGCERGPRADRTRGAFGSSR
jgi:hypothetical protein